MISYQLSAQFNLLSLRPPGGNDFSPYHYYPVGQGVPLVQAQLRLDHYPYITNHQTLILTAGRPLALWEEARVAAVMEFGLRRF